MAARGKGIILDFVANVAPFRKGTKQAEDALDDFGDSLTQVARDGDKAADKLERSFKDTARAVNKVSDDVRAQGTKVSDVGSEIGQEFSQNFGEAVRGGNPAEAITETVTSLGPAFGLAGLAAAAGAGLILATVKGAEEKAAAFRQAVEEIVGSAYDATVDLAAEAGVGAVRAFQQAWESNAVQDQQVRSALGVDSAEAALAELARLAEDTGFSISTIKGFILGNADAQALVRAEVEKTNALFAIGEETAGKIGETDITRLRALQDIQGAEERTAAAKERTLAASKNQDILDETRVENARLAADASQVNARNSEAAAKAAERQAAAAKVFADQINALARSGALSRGAANFEMSENRTRA